MFHIAASFGPIEFRVTSAAANHDGVRLLMLLAAEIVVHRRMLPVIRQFVERGLVADVALAQLRRRGSGVGRLCVRGRRERHLADTDRGGTMARINCGL